jgi:hypothetical protein
MRVVQTPSLVANLRRTVSRAENEAFGKDSFAVAVVYNIFCRRTAKATWPALRDDHSIISRSGNLCVDGNCPVRHLRTLERHQKCRAICRRGHPNDHPTATEWLHIENQYGP